MQATTPVDNQKGSGQLVGILPAGGKGERISPLPCSKELFPVGFQQIRQRHNKHPKVVSQYLLEKMRAAGAEKAFVVLRNGKWDIPAYFGDGDKINIHIAYLMMNRPGGAPYTIDQAYPFVQNDTVVFGFPDILFQPDNAFEQLLDKQENMQAEIVLGLFRADKPHKVDMVELDNWGRVQDICIKPDRTHLLYTWIIAVWTPMFSRFMHAYLCQAEVGSGREIYVGDVILAAIREGMTVETVIFDQGSYIDIGTPADLVKAVEGRWV